MRYMNPKYWAELDPFPVHEERLNKHVMVLTFDEQCKVAKRDGLAGARTTLCVIRDDDKDASLETLTRLVRCWNLCRDLDDEELSDAVVMSKKNAVEMLGNLSNQLLEASDGIREWQPGLYASDKEALS